MSHGKRIQSFNKAFGSMVNQVGFNAEMRALDASIYYLHELQWVASVRLSNKTEDNRGIDLVFETKNIGDIFLQIKSSYMGAKKFTEKRRSSLIKVVIIKHYENREDIWSKVKTAVLELRQEILKIRNEKDI